jgi:hypothetical protein
MFYVLIVVEIIIYTNINSFKSVTQDSVLFAFDSLKWNEI